ncbi:MAG: glycerol kinase GlpK [Sinobacteraceae bacterium]|nr:glycerol kinase GlpK [Nevskiaceae bacterium]
MSRWILALDQGTTSSRAILFDHGGSIVASAQQEFTQHFPQPGWVEHDPEEIWISQRGSMEAVLAKVGARPGDVAAVGITNQRETTVLWDRKTGKPIAPAIVWQDRRTAPHCQKLKNDGHEAEVTRRTGLLLDPYFSGTKIAWLLDNVPNARQRAERGELCFGTIDSWLVWKLTDGAHHLTDVTNASRTLLLNLHTGDWDPWMLDLLQIPRALLPKVQPSSIESGIRIAVGGASVPLSGIAGDQQAALFGQACLRSGMAKNTYGTGCFMLMHTGAAALPSTHRLLTTLACNIQAEHDQRLQYALEGSVFVGGAVVQWLRDGLGFVQHAEEIEALATSVSDHGGVYVVPAFTGLGSPYWDPFARGSIVGITRGTTRGHIARAALEAIAFQSTDLLEAMQRDAAVPLSELRVDGGASRNNFLMQFQADLLGVPVVRPAVTETTALGAAYLAGIAIGFWNSAEDVQSRWQMDRRFEPSISRDEAAGRMREWARAVERSRGWISPQA